MTSQEIIKLFLENNLSIIPIGEGKHPAISWKEYQSRLPTEQETANWQPPIAIIGGKVSGGIVCIDFDDKGSKYVEWKELVEMCCPGLTGKLVIQQTPSGGYHCVYRTNVSIRAVKLAEKENGGVLIETKSEGGYFLVCPSQNYKMIQGKWGGINTLPEHEHHVLIDCARSFNRKTREPKSVYKPSEHTGTTPFDDYDAKNDPVSLLVSHGWKDLFTRGNATYLKRPNKKERAISATWNYVKDRFFVFTTSTQFENNHVYKASAVYAILEHNGNFNEAARALFRDGYGKLELSTVQAGSLLQNMMTLKRSGYPKGVSTGLPVLDKYYKIAKGQLNIISGIPSHGKSSFIDFVIMNIAKKENWRFLIFSPENYPIEMHIQKLCELYIGQSFFSESTSDDMIASAVEFIAQYFDFIPPTDDNISIDAIFKLCEEKKYDGLLIDPWNELEYNRPKDMSETDYIGYVLQNARKFARKNNIALWIVAHPSKMYKDKEGNTPKPTMYSISGCYSDDTQVLTKRGWLNHSEVSMNDYVCCFNPSTNKIAYQKPKRIIKKTHKGLMYRFKGYGYDLLVTPEHRMIVKAGWKEPKSSGKGRPVKWDKDKFSFCEAQKIPSGRFFIPKSGNAIKKTVKKDSEKNLKKMWLAGFFVAEGCWQSAGLGLSQAEGKISEKLFNILNFLKFSYSSSVNAPGTNGTKKIVTWYLKYKSHSEQKKYISWIKKECGKGSLNVKVPDSLWRRSYALKKSFLEGYLDGDGCCDKKRKTWKASTTSKKLRDDLMRLAVELGIGVCSHKRKHKKEKHNDSWQINFSKEDRKEITMQYSRNVSITKYNGKVWCLEVPFGAYFVRRNGKALPCGNSAHWFNKADNGLIVWREMSTNIVEIIVEKVKFKYYGTRTKKEDVRLVYDLSCGRYRAYDREEEIWQKAY